MTDGLGRLPSWAHGVFAMNHFSIRRKLLVHLVLVSSFLAVSCSTFAAVSDEQIDEVRQKAILTELDLQVIDRFVTGHFAAIVSATEPSVVASARDKLVGAAKSKIKYDQQMSREYSDRFATAVKSSYKQVLALPSDSDDKELYSVKNCAVAMVLARTDNPLLIDDILSLLESDQSDIRYWAVMAFQEQDLKDYLSLDDQASIKQLASVLDRLTELLGSESEVIIISRLAQLAAALPGGAKSLSLLEGCVDNRIGRYKAWQTLGIINDLDILDSLLEFASSESEADSAQLKIPPLRKAAELFTAAYDHYFKSINYLDADGKPIVLLTNSTRGPLETFLIEGEMRMRRLAQSDRTSSRFRRAMQTRKSDDLRAAYNALLDCDGEFNGAFGIYTEVECQSGVPIPALPDPPAEFVQSAITLNRVWTGSVGNDLY